MNFWVFQGNPSRWRVFDFVRDGGTLRRTSWSVTRYRDLVAPGDGAALWLSGDDRVRGVYAIGSVTGHPEQRPAEDDGYWSDPADARRLVWSVDLTFPVLLFGGDHIRARDLRSDPAFAAAQIVRKPHAANPFTLTEAEWLVILELAPARARATARRVRGGPSTTPGRSPRTQARRSSQPARRFR